MNARIWWDHASRAIAAEVQSFKQRSKNNAERSLATDTASPQELASGVESTLHQIGETSNEVKVVSAREIARLTPTVRNGGTGQQRSHVKFVRHLVKLDQLSAKVQTSRSKNETHAAKKSASRFERQSSPAITTEATPTPTTQSTANSSQTIGRSSLRSINHDQAESFLWWLNNRPRLPIWLSLGWNSQIRLRAARRRSMLRHPAQRRRD